MTVEIQKADVPNGNGRIYPIRLLEKIVEDASNRQIYGTIGMPDETILNLSEISHKILNLRIENNCLIADYSIIDTPQGKILKPLIESSNGAFRCAGIGTIKKDNDNNEIVQNDYHLISINYTLDPA